MGTRLVTNNTANTSFEQSTLPFGTSLNAESTGTTNQRFTSYDRSAVSSLDYAVNRTYSSAQGRFTSVDPIGMSATSLGNPQSLNLYGYVENDPINATDPTGLLLAITRCTAVTTTVLNDDGSVSSTWTSYENCSQQIINIGNGPTAGGSGGGGGFGGGGGGGGTIVNPPPSNPPPQPTDPCAGNKGTIDPNQTGYPQAGIGHLSERHIDPQRPRYAPGGSQEKSYFEFGLLFTKGQLSATKPQREIITMGMMQSAFENGAANKLANDIYAYSFAPHLRLPLGISADFIGRDKSQNWNTTNARTVVLNTGNCQSPKLITGYPGLPSFRDGRPVNVRGVPVWASPTWIIPL